MKYTSQGQANMLIEAGLKPESADLVYKYCGVILGSPDWIVTHEDIPVVIGDIEGWDIPCWSAGALMDLLPDKFNANNSEYELVMYKDGINYVIGYKDNCCIKISKDMAYSYDYIFKSKGELIVVLTEMIIWLLTNKHI